MGQLNSPESKPTSSRASRTLAPYLLLALGLLFTLLVSYYLSKLAETQDQSRFRSSVQAIDAKIHGRIQTFITLLRAGTGLYAASETVTPDEFNRFVDRLELQKNYSGIQGLGFSLRLRPEEKNALAESMRRSGIPDFKIWPDYPRDEYHAITYLQPQNERNRIALGYDMFTEPVRRAAMEQARDTGGPAASGRVFLVQEVESHREPGFIIYAPVYRNTAPQSTPEERREALTGFIYGPFRAGDFMAGIF